MFGQSQKHKTKKKKTYPSYEM